MANKKRTRRAWTLQDEECLIQEVKNHVTNLSKAFEATSKQIGRSPKAIAARWYQRTSIQSGHCLFLTVSGKHIAINRKNGKGQPTTLPFYKKVLAVFGLSY